MNANLIAVGAPYVTPAATLRDAGMVHLVGRKDESLTSIKDFTGTKFDEMGASVALSRGISTGKDANDNIDVLVIGAPRHSVTDDLVNVGTVKVFYYSDRQSKWIQMGQELVGTQSNEFFGEVVAISDDGLVIGIGSPIGDALHRGRVEMFKYNEIVNRWDKMGYTLEGHEHGAKFGSSLSIAQKQNNDGKSENYYVAVGAPQVGKGRGIVQVYNWDSDLGNWDQLGFDLNGDEVQDQLGYSISLSMTDHHLFLAIGVPSAKYYGNLAGGGTGTGAGGVAADDDDIADAAPTDSRVQVYRYNTNVGEDTQWIYFGDEIEQFENGDGTGQTVELSQDGMYLAVGSPDYQGGAGMVRVYHYDSAYGDYVRMGDTLYGQPSQAFGTCLSFYGNDLAVGAPYGDSVQVFTYEGSLGSGSHSKNASSGNFNSVLTTSLVLAIIGFVVFATHKKLKNRGFRWSSFAAALPGAAAIRRRGREAVSTEEQRDEWPFPFFSASDRARIEEVRRAEEGRSHEDVDGVVLHGMPKSSGSQSAASSSGSDDDDDDDDDDIISHDSREESGLKMRKIT